MMNDDNIEKARSPSARAGGPSPWAERGCGPGEASCPDMVYWRVSSHEWDHDRFVVRLSADHPCCTCALNSARSIGASYSNACHASHSSKSFATHGVYGPGTTHRSLNPGIGSVSPPFVITPLRPGWVQYVCQILHICTPITPRW